MTKQGTSKFFELKRERKKEKKKEMEIVRLLVLTYFGDNKAYVLVKADVHKQGQKVNIAHK